MEKNSPQRNENYLRNYIEYFLDRVFPLFGIYCDNGRMKIWTGDLYRVRHPDRNSGRKTYLWLEKFLSFP